MSKIFAKREIVLLDIHKNVEKNHIDNFLKSNYGLEKSKMEKKVCVEFKSSNIAKDVKSFLDDKELIYRNKSFRIQLRGNCFYIDGMYDVPFEEIRSFFQNYGEVKNVFYSKKYFATLTSIKHAVELVEKIGSLKIDGKSVEIKYAFDRNIGNSGSSNRNFEIKDIESKKAGDSLVNATKKLNLNGSRSNLNGSRSNLNGSRSNLNGGQNKNGNIKGSQSKNSKKRNRRDKETNENLDSSKFSINVPAGKIETAGEVNSLVSNPNVPLFAKGPNLINNSTGFRSLDQLNYKSPNLKPINYLEEKEKLSETIVTNYYNKMDQSKWNSNYNSNTMDHNAANFSQQISNLTNRNGNPLLPTPNSTPTKANNNISKAYTDNQLNFNKSPAQSATPMTNSTPIKVNNSIPKVQSFNAGNQSFNAGNQSLNAGNQSLNANTKSQSNLNKSPTTIPKQSNANTIPLTNSNVNHFPTKIKNNDDKCLIS